MKFSGLLNAVFLEMIFRSVDVWYNGPERSDLRRRDVVIGDEGEGGGTRRRRGGGTRRRMEGGTRRKKEI